MVFQIGCIPTVLQQGIRISYLLACLGGESPLPAKTAATLGNNGLNASKQASKQERKFYIVCKTLE